MKKLLTILAAITLATSSTLAFASQDMTTIWVKKSTDTTAMICTNSKCIGTVPIKFVDDTTWSDVKDSYEVSTSEEAALAGKCSAITVHGDGGISISKGVCTASKASNK